MMYCPDLPDWWEIFSDWLNRWQTLAAGILAISGGLAVVCQTTQAKKEGDARLAREHRAQKAILPLILSDIVLACRASLRDHIVFNLPQNSAERLFEFSKSATDNGLTQLVHEICKRIQVRLARQTEMMDIGSEIYIEFAEIVALCERLLLYCNDEKAAPYEVGWDAVINALQIVGLRRNTHPEVFARWQQSKDAHDVCWRPKND